MKVNQPMNRAAAQQQSPEEAAMTDTEVVSVKVADRYTVRPSEVLAVKWDGTLAHAKTIVAWTTPDPEKPGPVRQAYINRNGVLTVEPGNTMALVVQSPRGEVIVREGGYVIRNESGSVFGDTADRFEADYMLWEWQKPEDQGESD